MSKIAAAVVIAVALCAIADARPGMICGPSGCRPAPKVVASTSEVEAEVYVRRMTARQRVCNWFNNVRSRVSARRANRHG